MCLLAYAGFFRISEPLSIRRSNIVTEDLYHKIFIEVSKTDKYREGSWVYIAKAGNFTCPFAYLIKYLEAARILSFSQKFIFRSLRYDKNLKGNVLSSKPLTPSNSAANLNVPDRLFKVHGRWKSDSAKDYVHDKLDLGLYVPLHIGI